MLNKVNLERNSYYYSQYYGEYYRSYYAEEAPRSRRPARPRRHASRPRPAAGAAGTTRMREQGDHAG